MNTGNLKIGLAALALSLVTSAVVLPATADAQSLFDRAKSLFKGGEDNAATTELTTGDVADGLREALRIGSGHVVDTLGKTDGFYGSPDVHIPLPRQLAKVQSALGKIGQSGLTDDLELRLNRAAETAVPRARELFLTAISDMTIDDALGILNGADDAATSYFRDRMSPELTAEMTPIVAEELANVGALQVYDQAISRYENLPFVPDARTDLTGYVVEKSIDGIFLYLAREEAAIRADPARRTTALLKKVFGR